MPYAPNGRWLPAPQIACAQYMFVAGCTMGHISNAFGETATGPRTHHNALRNDRRSLKALDYEIKKQLGCSADRHWYKAIWPFSSTPPHLTEEGLAKTPEVSAAARQWAMAELRRQGLDASALQPES